MSRVLYKVFFYVVNSGLSLIDGRFPRIYMRFYTRLLKIQGVKLVGSPRYISSSCKWDDFNRVVLSERVVISADVVLLTHDYSLTTAMISTGNKTSKGDVGIKGNIFISENVFIGYSSIVLPNTIIEPDVVIGAGSVVRGKVESGFVYAGNPLQKIMSLERYYSNSKRKKDLDWFEDK